MLTLLVLGTIAIFIAILGEVLVLYNNLGESDEITITHLEKKQ